jgi:hypothetical protein
VGDRRTELRLYKTGGGKYLLSRSTFVREQGKHEVWTLDSPHWVVELLKSHGMGRLDKELLRLAAEADSAFVGLITEKVD